MTKIRIMIIKIIIQIKQLVLILINNNHYKCQNYSRCKNNNSINRWSMKKLSKVKKHKFNLYLFYKKY